MIGTTGESQLKSQWTEAKILSLRKFDETMNSASIGDAGRIWCVNNDSIYNSRIFSGIGPHFIWTEILLILSWYEWKRIHSLHENSMVKSKKNGPSTFTITKCTICSQCTPPLKFLGFCTSVLGDFTDIFRGFFSTTCPKCDFSYIKQQNAYKLQA